MKQPKIIQKNFKDFLKSFYFIVVEFYQHFVFYALQILWNIDAVFKILLTSL